MVAALELAAGRRQAELHQDAVFEEQAGAGRGNLDIAGRAGYVEVQHLAAVLAAHQTGLVPAPHPGVARRVGGLLGVGGEHAGGQGQVELQGPRAFVDTAGHADAAQLAGQVVQFAPVVGHLHPVAVVEAQHIVAADALDRDAVARRVDVADPRSHRGIVP